MSSAKLRPFCLCLNELMTPGNACYASVTSHSRAPYGLFTGCSRAVLNKNRTSTHGAHTGPVRRRTNFASPYGSRRISMHALYAYGPRTGFEIVNSPWTVRAGTVWGPYGQIRRPWGIFTNYGCVNSLMCPQGRRTAPLLVTHGPRTGPVGYEKHWRFPCGAPTMPVRASHGLPVESCELFNQTISMQTCQAVRGP